METDVRNLGGRLATGLAVTVCGIAGAYAAAALAAYLVRHPADHMGGLATGQRDFFALASTLLGFLIGGAIGGIAIEVIRRRQRHRRPHRALPRMVLVRRSTTDQS